MANKKIFMGMLAMVLVFMLGVAGCASYPITSYPTIIKLDSLQKNIAVMQNLAGTWVESGGNEWDFNVDGTGEYLQYRGDTVISKQSFLWGASDSMFAFSGINIEGARPYRIEQQRLIFPSYEYYDPAKAAEISGYINSCPEGFLLTKKAI
jgi:hypothetical protein